MIRPFVVPGLVLSLFAAASSFAVAQSDPVHSAAVAQGQRDEAEIFLRAADEAYEARHFAEASEAYQATLELLPDTSSNVLWRERAAQGWVAAGTAWSRELVGSQQAGQAEDVLLSLSANPLAKDDPRLAEAMASMEESKEPANTPSFRADLAEVDELLAIGESQVRIGLLDEAVETFYRVLAIDPYNAASRRGLERVAKQKLEFGDNAVENATRAELLEMVAKGWELEVPVAGEFGRIDSGEGGSGSVIAGRGLRADLASIVLDDVDFLDMPLPDVLELLRLRSAEENPSGQPINFTFIGNSNELQDRSVTLSLRDVALDDLLDFIAETTHTSWGLERGVVVFRMGGGQRVFTESYTVPPDIFQNLSLEQSSQDKSNPFERSSVKAGPQRVGVQQTLESLGIEFTESTAVSYSSTSSVLNFTGTSNQHQYLRDLVDHARVSGQRQVQVQVTIMRVLQFNGEEFGFDTLLGAANIPGSERAFFSGGSYGNSAQGSNQRQYPFNLPGTNPTTPVGQNPLTGGLRSGGEVFASDSINDIINSAGVATSGRQLEAPGIFSLAGVFTDVQWQTVLRGLNQSSSNDFIAAPSVVTRSGQQTQMTQRREIIYPGDYDPPELPTSVSADANGGFPVTPASPRDFTVDFEGVNLDVLPTISADGRSVVLDINPQMRVFEGFINYGSPITQPRLNMFGNPQPIVVTENRILQPVFRNFDLHTQVTLYDGETLVLGGVLRDDVVRFVDKVPFFGDIPLLGRLFQSRGEERSREAVVFSVSVDVLDPGGRPIRKR